MKRIVSWLADKPVLPKNFRFVKSESVDLDWYLKIKEFDADLEKRMWSIKREEITGLLNDNLLEKKLQVIGKPYSVIPIKHFHRYQRMNPADKRKLFSAIFKKSWENPNIREKIIKNQKCSWTVERRMKRGQEIKTLLPLWQTPEIKSKRIQAIKAYWAKATPEIKAKRRQLNKASWSKERREHQAQIMRERHSKRGVKQ